MKKATKLEADPAEWRTLAEHPLLEAADERIDALGGQVVEMNEQVEEAEKEKKRVERRRAETLAQEGSVPAEITRELEEIEARCDQCRYQLRALDAAREKAVEDRAALIEELREEIAEDLRERYAEAIERLHAVLCDAAVLNEQVKQLEEAGRRLCGRTYGGAGTENTAGIGTGGGSMLIPVSPLPDLAWRELSIRTSPTQSTTRLLHWIDFVNDALGLELEKPEIE